jgi:hypothetical protein
MADERVDVPVMCRNLPVSRRPFAIVLPSSLALEPWLFPATDAPLGGAAVELPQKSSPQIRAPRRSMAKRDGVGGWVRQPLKLRVQRANI